MSQPLAYSSAPPDRLTLSGMITQTLAMVLDAYRELNSKKLFWITMVLSGIVVGVFGAVGFDERGFSIFGVSFADPFLNTKFLPIAQLYKNLFISLGVKWWLASLALLLALISTSPMFPDFVSGGAVDLFLARPISRVRLFLTKYFIGTLFVAMQVAIFCLVSFLIIGWRAGSWVPGIFLAVPIVVLTYSYLWSVCALIGTLTRSTIAALLLTTLFWLAVVGIHVTELILLQNTIAAKFEAEVLRVDVAKFEAEIAALKLKSDTTKPTTADSGRQRLLESMLNMTERSLDRAERTRLATWHRIFYSLKVPLPKTAETASLMERILDRQFFFEPKGQFQKAKQSEERAPDRGYFSNVDVQSRTDQAVDVELRSRSVTWVIGTSLLFEGALLGLATWVFARRDF